MGLSYLCCTIWGDINLFLFYKEFFNQKKWWLFSSVFSAFMGKLPHWEGDIEYKPEGSNGVSHVNTWGEKYSRQREQRV